MFAFKEAFGGAHALPLNPENVLAVLSMMFWAVTLVVAVKYVTFMLRFDHRGEGGALVLLTFALRAAKGRRLTMDHWHYLFVLAACLVITAPLEFFGEGVYRQPWGAVPYGCLKQPAPRGGGGGEPAVLDAVDRSRLPALARVA